MFQSRRIRMPLIALVVVLVLCFAPVAAQSPFPGDDAFARMDYRTAIATYDSLAKVRPNDVQVQWRLARAHVFFGDISKGEEKKPRQLERLMPGG